MRILRLKGRQRAMLADKLPDLGNIAMAALAFGQAFSDYLFSPVLGMIGVGIWITLMVVAVVMAAKEEQP
jgi:hypothetical protein